MLDPAGNSWLTGNTSSTDFPVTPGAPDTTFNGGTTDAIIAELNSTGTALPFATFLGGSQSERGYDIARDPTGNMYITGQTLSQNFPATVGAFDRVFNGDLSIFWGDAFITKIDINATTSTPPAPPGFPAAPTLVSPSNASSQPQPITFDWNDVPRGRVVHHPDRRLERVHRTTRPRTERGLVGLCDKRSGDHDAFLAGPGREFGGCRRRLVVGPQLHARHPAAARGAGDARCQSIAVEGGTSAAGTVVMSVGATNGALVSLSSSNPAVASVPATTTVAPNGFTGTFTVTTVGGHLEHPGHDHRQLQREHQDRAPDGDTRGRRGCPAECHREPVERGRRCQYVGFVSLSGPLPSVAQSCRCPAATRPWSASRASVTVAEGTTARGFTVTTAGVSTTTSAIITASYNGTTVTATATVTPAAPPPPPPRTSTLTVTATGRSGETVVSTPRGVSVRTGSTGTTTFASGTAVTLRVSSGRSAVWTGACSSAGSRTTSCTFTVNANAAVTANIQ